MKDALKEIILCFLVQAFFVFSYIDPDKAAQIAAISVEKNIELFSEYTDYAKVFSPKESVKLLKLKLRNYRIIMKEGKTSLLWVYLESISIRAWGFMSLY